MRIESNKYCVRMAKLYEMDLSSPIFKKVAILRKERTFLVFFYATLGVCRGHSQGRRAFIPPFTCAPLTYSQGNRVPSFQPDQQGAKHPETLDLCGKPQPQNARQDCTESARRTVQGRLGRRRYYLARTGSGAVKARSVPARKPKFFDHFATSSAVNARRSPKTNPIFSFCVHSSTGRAPTFQAGDVGSRPAARSNKRTNAWKSKPGGLPT